MKTTIRYTASSKKNILKLVFDGKVKAMKKIFKVLIFLLISITSLSEIKIGVDDSNPAVKQNIILTIEFLNETKSEYEIEGIDNFKIMSMGSRSNYNTTDGKKVKYSKSDIYTLSPQLEGIVSLIVKSKSGTVSNRITLNISKERKESGEEKFILETTNYKRDYYYGEKIPFVEKVIIKKSISNYSYVSTPVFNGFSIKNVTPRDGRGFAIPKRVTVNGKEQIELVLFRSILEPVSAGQKLIKTGGISITETTDDDKEKNPVYLGFKEIGINVLPLPEENKPENFQGVVGKLKGNYKWSEETIKDKKVLVLRLKLFGTVNLDKLEKIVYSDDDNFRIKENIIMFDEHVLDHVYSAEKKYVIIFIPKHSGDFKPPQIKIPYFNPVEREYDEFIISSDSVNIMSDEEFYETDYEKEDFTSVYEENKYENNFIISDEKEGKSEVQTFENTAVKNKNEIKNTKSSFAAIIFAVIAVIEALYIFKLKRKK